ncbi:phage portal protein [Hymenobacter canadensis]|uniref:Phage portal protein n=1 Tax=Hymenobacter canadensis TaxID=2999067 RepID=A0ABY7LWN4_9BACT|nr:phage portal protein [Hymenobacter canadensis]WBA43155.1 phage portal protein [Hymenobacter canadensis]
MPILSSIKNFFYAPEAPAVATETKVITGVDAIGRVTPFYSSSFGGDSFTARTDVNAVFYTILNAIQTAAKKVQWSVYKLEKDENAAKIPQHPLAEVIYRPNPNQSWTQFVETFIGRYLTRGNVFIYALRAESGLNKGHIQRLYIMPDTVEIVAENGWLGGIISYRVPNGSGYTEFAPEDVLHVKKFSSCDGLYGLSPISAMALPLKGIEQSLKQKIRILGQGGPATVYWTESSDNENVEPLTLEQEMQLNSRIVGGKSSYVTQKLDSTTIGLSPADLEILENIAADGGMVADALAYPSLLLSGSKSNTYSNYSEAQRALYENCVIPLLNELRDGLNQKWGSAYKDKAYIDFTTEKVAVLQPNTAELIKSAQSADFLTVNEKRKLSGFERLELNGDVFLLSAAVQVNEKLEADEPIGG